MNKVDTAKAETDAWVAAFSARWRLDTMAEKELAAFVAPDNQTRLCPTCERPTIDPLKWCDIYVLEENESLRKQLGESEVKVNHLEWDLREAREHVFGNLNAAHPCSRCGVTTLDDHAGYDCVAWLKRQLGEQWDEAIEIIRTYVR